MIEALPGLSTESETKVSRNSSPKAENSQFWHMYIKQIAITYLKGIEELKFDFARPDGSYAGLNVITGDNGSGKSSLLKAVCLALAGPEYVRAIQNSLKGWVKIGFDEAIIELEIVGSQADEYLKRGNIKKDFPIRFTINGSGEMEPSFRFIKPNSKSKSEEERLSMPERTVWLPESKGWFYCAYGPFRRVFGASADAQRDMVGNVTEKVATLFREDAALTEVDRWLKLLSHKALEDNPNAQNELGIVFELLQLRFLPNDFRLATVSSEGIIIADRNDDWFSFLELSDGYRSAIALIADILRHLIKSYGTDDFLGRYEDGTAYCKKEGVVLIDELDAHLHPEWQREIGFWLKSRFPNIQFIVTSHSPIICQAASEDGIFHLPEPGSDQQPFQLKGEDFKRVVASTPSQILLNPIFALDSTYSAVANASRVRFAQLAAIKRGGAELSAEEEREMKALRIFAEAR